MLQLEHIDAIERRLWSAADTLLLAPGPLVDRAPVRSCASSCLRRSASRTPSDGDSSYAMVRAASRCRTLRSKELFYAAGRIHFDRRPCPEFSMENDLDEETWAQFSSRAKLPEAMDRMVALRNLGLLDGDDRMTHAGAWLLARDIRRWVRLFFVDGPGRPRGLLRAARQELLDPSKAWWGGRRGRLADRPCYSISVSLGVVPLVLPRRGSPSTHRSRGWLRSTRSFRTASAPTKLATRRIRTRAWMKQGYCVAPACTSELHPVADQVPHAPSMAPVAMEHRHRLADVLGHVDDVDCHTVRSTAALARSSCVSAPSTSATHPGAQPAPSRRSSPGGVPAGAAASARHRRPPRPDRRPLPGCVERGVLARACASTPGPVGAAPVRARSHSSAGLRAMRGRLWPQRRWPRPPHTAPGRGKRRCEPRLASLNSPATAGPCWAPHRHGGSVGPCDLDRWRHPTRPRRHVPRTSSSLLRPSQRHLPSQCTVPNAARMFRGAEGTTEASGRRD